MTLPAADGTDPDPTRSPLAARLLLSRLAEPGDARVGAALRVHGPAGLTERILAGADAELAVYRARLPAGRDPADVVADDLAAARDLDARIVLPDTADWPTQLDDLGERRPLLLWLRGTAPLRLAAMRSVSVVGSRASTRYGTEVAADLGAGLAEAGWTVVSGGAYGIDAAAHRGAMAVGGTTIAVLACGADIVYPREHERLFAQLIDSGLLVTEAPPGAPPYRGRFLVRNRVIAALSRGTVVVEAALRSGSLATAREAEGLGRIVMGVPGPVTSTMSAGVHGALRGGALLVSSTEEVIEAVGEIGRDLAPVRRGPQSALDGLDEQSRRVLDALPARGAAQAGEVATTAGVPEGAALAMLGLLELEGFVRRDPSGWRVVHRARQA